LSFELVNLRLEALDILFRIVGCLLLHDEFAARFTLFSGLGVSFVLWQLQWRLVRNSVRSYLVFDLAGSLSIFQSVECLLIGFVELGDAGDHDGPGVAT